MSEDIPGTSCILIAEFPEPLPGGCCVRRIPSWHGLKVFKRVFIEALWWKPRRLSWNLDLGSRY